MSPLLILVLLAHLSPPLLAAPFAGHCPASCNCSWVLDDLTVRCANRALTASPPFAGMPIQHLDLSRNHFVEFPSELADVESLLYLDLSDNRIEYLEPNALLGFTALRTLLLTNNSVASWASLSPRAAFRNAISLQRLSLSGNHLATFTDDNPKAMLASESLTRLELERCGITAVGGDHLVNGLPNLEELSLAGNAFATIANLPSPTLRHLRLSNCNLQRLSAFLLQGLPSLESLDVSRNAALQFGTPTDRIASYSLNELDVSFCNLNQVQLSGLPALTVVRLQGNMLGSLAASSFANNTQLEVINVSRNSLRLLEADAFAGLKRLARLDLSYNEIARLDRNIFRANDALVQVDLSRNVIERFTKLVSNSLRDINLSWCAIIAVDSAALAGLASIQRVDLSNNLVKDLPSNMRSETLQTLNLSSCRLSIVRNSTFRDFPELASLSLSGNRFTNPFSPQFFRSNKFLDQIWLGDNPWICDCLNPMFMDFYDFLTAKPQKLKDKDHVRCASPANYYGKSWEMACIGSWDPNARSSKAERVWTTIMLSVVVISVLIFLFTCFQRYMNSRKQRNSHREYRQNQEEMMEIRRQNQRMLDEEGTPNAPDAFETTLPSYEDAIRMPKPERPIKSMVDLSGSGRSRHKLRRTRTEPEAEGDEDDLMLDNRQRFRSEEMLSNRDKERTVQFAPFRRTGRIDHNNSGSRRFSIEESRFPAAHLKSQNLQSAEQIGNFQSYENSPYTKRRTKIAEIPPFKRATLHANSVEFLTDPEFDGSSKPSSPFARRKPKSVSVLGSSRSNMLDDVLGGDRLQPAVEDHFGTAPKSRSTSTDGSDFQVLVEAEVASLPDANDSWSSSAAEKDGGADRTEPGKRKKRRNSSSRRASGNFNAAAAAAGDSSSASDLEAIVVVHKPMRETLF